MKKTWNSRKRPTSLFFSLAALALLLPTEVSAQQLTRQTKTVTNVTTEICKQAKPRKITHSRPPMMGRIPSSSSLTKAHNNVLCANRLRESGRFDAYQETTQKKTTNAGVKMLGMSTYNSNMSEEHPTGLYEITGDGSMTNLNYSEYYPTAGAWVTDNVYYGFECFTFLGVYQSVDLFAYDMDTWALREDLCTEYDNTELFATTVAYNYNNDEIYGCFYDFDTESYSFAKADIQNGSKSVVCGLAEGWSVSFFDDKNNLYAIDYGGNLYRVNTADGTMTLINATGFTPYYNTGAAYDSLTGRAYWAVCDEDNNSYIVEIDLTTGKGEKMFEFEYHDQVCGLYVTPPAAEAGAPAAVSDFAVTFPDGALSGTATFTMPTTTFDGTAATGELTYTIYKDNVVYATATSSYGDSVEIPVTVETDGTYTFSIVATNSVGDSPKIKQKQYVGHDTPNAPTNVKAEWADGVFTVTWDAATTTVNDGYVDPEAITYTVTRYPDNVVVAENINVTTLSDNVAEPTDFTIYRYIVTASYDGRTSSESASDKIFLGKITPPYNITFDSEESMEGYTVIDANGDGNTWSILNNTLCVRYNSDADMDDWMITPPISLEGGKIYEISFYVSAKNGDYPEKYELRVGNSNTVEGMITTLVEATETRSTEPESVTLYYTPESDGRYYFGLHGISDADMYRLNYYEFSISAPMSPDAPCEVSDIVITPNPSGDTEANIAFTAPTKNYHGDKEITEITKIEVYRDGTLIRTFDNPTPGSALNFDDSVEDAGIYTYEFVPFNSAGRGKNCFKSSFIGINVPGVPGNVVARDNNGEVTVTWDAPTEDKDGNSINPDLITYTVCEYAKGNLTVIEQDITDLSLTYQSVEPDADQVFKQFAVFASTDAGIGDGGITQLIAVGNPYALPYTESFANAGISHILGVSADAEDCSWNIYTDDDFNVADANGDNGFIGMKAETLGDSGKVFTGKITIDAKSPMFSFFTYYIVDSDNTENTNEITLCVSEDGGNTYTDLKTFVINQDCNAKSDWNKLKYDLSDYIGKSIIVGLKCKIMSHAYIILDNFKLAERRDNDIIANRITAPLSVNPGEEFNVDLRLTNDGELDAKGVKVELYHNGAKIAEKEGYDIDADEYCSVKFTDTLNVTNEGENEYYAVAVYVADENHDNNTTATVTVKIKSTYYPTVENLSGELDENGVRLKWEAPILETGSVRKTITDDFEDYTSWSNSAGDWTFVDADGYDVGGISSVTLPGISGPQSYWIMDRSNDQLVNNNTFNAHSGDKYLAQIYVKKDGEIMQCDDWAISPRLHGGKQTIYFYAKSYSSNYPETFEVLYSTTDKELSSFTSVGTVEDAPEKWTEYSFDLPEGAVYFAIRCVSYDRFMLFIDDVTYTIKEGDYELLGYNIYREGVKLNDAPVTDTSFLYTEAETGDITYSVSAVYTIGESPAVNVTVTTNKADTLTADALSIAVDGREIVITNADGAEVTITTADGKIVARRNDVSDMRIAVEKGVYIVKASKHTAKLIVK